MADKFFALFGKIALVVLFVVAFAAGGYIIGKKTNIPFLSQPNVPE